MEQSGISKDYKVLENSVKCDPFHSGRKEKENT